MTDRDNLPPFNRAFVGLVVASLAGALLGAVLLLATPTRMFEQLIPLLLGFATILFGFAGRITQWLRSRAKDRGDGDFDHDSDRTRPDTFGRSGFALHPGVRRKRQASNHG